MAIALAAPAVALAAPRDDRDRSQQAGLARSRPAAANPLTAPVERFRRAIRIGVRRVRVARHRQAVRQRREQREAFEALPGGVSQATLDAIGACESGGDPTAVSADGSYRGKYQFSYGTWASVGGSGDPAAASEAEQDYRAALLYSRSGSSPWPVCG
ncbi:MAG TPA: transglycosylase family protein [Solirubrobacterales bacterium]